MFFFAILAKGGSRSLLSPASVQLDETLAVDARARRGEEALWLEDLIAREHGPGEQPRDERR